jgi:hypothetical protein
MWGAEPHHQGPRNAPIASYDVTAPGQSLRFFDVPIVSLFTRSATKSRTSRHFGFGP